MFADELKDLQAELVAHPVYSAVRNMNELHRFMRIHVFAVWDFMSLTKRLQNVLTCTQIPWIPLEDETSVRLINEIVLSEESDVDRDGTPASHLALYLKAMREVGAPTRMFDTFLRHLKQGNSVSESLETAGVPQYAREFVGSNIRLAEEGSKEEVAACFLFGREDPIPKMFRALLATWGIPPEETPGMVYYLERHIELDSEEHGPAAMNILDRMIADDRDKYARALESARQAIRARIRLWDGILADIHSAQGST